ncbi:MAG: hypothetical protein ACLUFN_10325 [Eubacterium sp.]
MRTTNAKDIIEIALAVWSNVIATMALVVTIKQGKKKTAPKKRTKQKRKR